MEACMMPTMSQQPLYAYESAIVQRGLWSSAPALRRYVGWLFGNVALRGARVLDIGGGTGVFSLYAAAMGAREVVCLEPQAEGGTEDMNEAFASLQDATRLGNVRLVRSTFQRYDGPGGFDLVLLHNSINHLDEAATMRLHRDPAARSTYRHLFQRMRELLVPGGRLLIADCARSNLFPVLGLPHPISRDIEWHKHQDPALWIALLRDAGFANPRVGWSSYNRLGAVGWALLANRVGAFLVTGHFRLLMQRR
jgi:SAM-dependent methyltransferase